MPDERETLMPGQMRQVLRVASDEVIHPHHLMPFSEQAITQV